ncbi:MAG: hypothetical protein H8D87_13430 [Deltaproteobacteria bacterium]|uniref:hypothetical protein n=1 Tax=Desulfobacula sp. TaxID=2593537 RepID=UPI0019B31C0C|nr:hypothetical protein [Candidatus Desulfobacula maris]MBL6992788.1 hypothetical protein [Desulfobacula sp.]
MTPFDKFNISSVSKKLNNINVKISAANDKPFPCLVLLSNYQFTKRFVKIMPNGDIQGGYTKMITSLIDFSFVRSLTASCYRIKSPPAYDPVSLFLLELFRFIDCHQNMDKFLKVLRDHDRGNAYRTYAGICGRVPTKGTFSNFKARLGESLYNEIFHVLVDIFYLLQMITFNMLAHDGTLFPTRARYKGCTWFSDKCSCIDIHDIVFRVKRQIMYRLNNLNKVNLDKAFRIKCECPFVPEDKVMKKPPKMEVLSMKLGFIDGKQSENQINTAILFGVKQELDKQGMFINVIRSNLFEINPCEGHAKFRCPKIPKDTDARIGVRMDPQNANRKQKIFGYNLVMSTSVELDLKLELPVAATNIAGNAEEGKKIITNTEQVRAHHDCATKIDIADAKYDTTENYTCLRKNGSIPIIDYNRRNEKFTSEALRERGYDQNGWPYAPCGILTKPNGFDKKHQRHTFCCFKQCLDLKAAGIKNIQKDYDIGSCPHVKNSNGFSKHTYIKDNPRLINEIPRGTKRFKMIQRYRSASERANSTIKEDLKIIEKPIVYNKERADILAQIAVIALLLKRAFAFIARISALFMLYQLSKDPAIAEKLQPHHVPKSILSLIQRE